MSSPSPKTASEPEHRVANWSPNSLISSTFTKDNPMTFQQSLDLAEIEADLAFERYIEAFNADEHPEFIETLTTEAKIAQSRYDDMINLVPAH